MAPTTIAVVGAGVAGLQTAAQLKEAGYSVTVFEKSGDIGGVWQSNYAGYRLQVQKWHYEIPGFPWNDGVSPAHPRYPTGPEVQAYLQRYAADAGLLPLIRFHVDVKVLRPVAAAGKGAAAGAGAPGWEVEWTDRAGTKHKQAFDYAVVATGLFNEPERPEWAQGLASAKPPTAGPWVVDAKDFTDASLAQGKRVVVVGAGKTAHDVGVAVSEVATSATLVARRGAWMAPQKVLGFIPFEFASYTRWSWALQPAWYSAGPIKKGAHTLFRPIKAAAWGLFGLIFPIQTGTPSAIKPKQGLLEGVYDTVGMVDSRQLSKAFKSGRLAAKAGRVSAVTPTGVDLEDGTSLEVDIVVLATGYRATARSLLPQELQAAAGYKGDSQWLYRNVLPPGLSNLAFIGQNATFQHVLTTALQSRWLADVLKGKIQVPPAAEQQKDVEAQEAWLAKFGGVNRTNNFVWAQHGKYHDALVHDIRGSTAAYPWNPVAEWFGYIKNQRYASLFPGNQALRAGQSSAKGSAAGIPVAATVAASA